MILMVVYNIQQREPTVCQKGLRKAAESRPVFLEGKPGSDHRAGVAFFCSEHSLAYCRSCRGHAGWRSYREARILLHVRVVFAPCGSSSPEPACEQPRGAPVCLHELGALLHACRPLDPTRQLPCISRLRTAWHARQHRIPPHGHRRDSRTAVSG